MGISCGLNVFTLYLYVHAFELSFSIGKKKSVFIFIGPFLKDLHILKPLLVATKRHLEQLCLNKIVSVTCSALITLNESTIDRRIAKC